MKAQDAPVDIAYTWVDSSDENWQRLYAECKRHLTPEHIYDSFIERRFRNNNELLYSLRSLEQFAPWVNRVYLVTCMNQIPSWLNTNHKKLTVIDHSTIFCWPQDLPTFNSNAIECHLSRIPDLSFYYLVLNDDNFFGAPVSKKDFIGEDETIRVHLEDGNYIPSGEVSPDDNSWIACLKNYNQLLDDAFGKQERLRPIHQASVFRKDVMEELYARWPCEVRQTSASKFRRGTDIQVTGLAKHLSLLTGKGVRSTITERMVKLMDDCDENAKEFRIISQDKPKLFCINDDTIEPSPVVHRDLTDFLESYYPTKSSFER